MKDSNHTPYDWEKDDGVFVRPPSEEQEEIRLYKPVRQEEKSAFSDAPEQSTFGQDVEEKEEMDEDYRNLLNEISAHRKENFYSASPISEGEESEYSQFDQPKPERAEDFRLQIEEEDFDEPTASDFSSEFGQSDVPQEQRPSKGPEPES